MDRTLLLNTTFEPLGIVSWRKAINLVCLGKVEIIREYEKEIRGINKKMRQPAVIRLLRFIRNNHAAIKFSRKNIFLRDNYTCQYCGKRFEPKDLTFDHIIPRSRGGITEWSNIVTSCIKCNLKKGDRLPEEINMQPRKRPSRPNGMYIFMLHLGINTPPDLWRDYMFMRG